MSAVSDTSGQKYSYLGASMMGLNNFNDTGSQKYSYLGKAADWLFAGTLIPTNLQTEGNLHIGIDVAQGQLLKVKGSVDSPMMKLAFAANPDGLAIRQNLRIGSVSLAKSINYKIAKL
jgi:hypothetical protein